MSIIPWRERPGFILSFLGELQKFCLVSNVCFFSFVPHCIFRTSSCLKKSFLHAEHTQTEIENFSYLYLPLWELIILHSMSPGELSAVLTHSDIVTVKLNDKVHMPYFKGGWKLSLYHVRPQKFELTSSQTLWFGMEALVQKKTLQMSSRDQNFEKKIQNEKMHFVSACLSLNLVNTHK